MVFGFWQNRGFRWFYTKDKLICGTVLQMDVCLRIGSSMKKASYPNLFDDSFTFENFEKSHYPLWLAEKKKNAELKNMLMSTGFIFMSKGLMNFYSKKSSLKWIPHFMIYEKNGRWYTEKEFGSKNKYPKPELVNGIVFDLYLDGSIKSSVELANGIIIGDVCNYAIALI